MATQSVIPCKRPKVTVTPRTPGDDRHDADCHVPRCGWTYPSDKQFMALVSDAGDQATRHRAAHRDAVPSTRIERDPLFDVYCQPCGGHRRTLPTRKEAEAWLAEHLTTEHGLVVCS